MFIYSICTQYLVGAPFALITASIRRGMEVISLWHCWGVWKPRFIWQWPSAHLHFLVSCFSFSHIFSMEFKSGEFVGQSSTPTPWSFNQLLVLLAEWAGDKSCWKIQHSVNSQLLWQWMFVAYPPCEGCQLLSSGQLSDQQSSPWLCSLVNQTERPFWRLRKPLQVFWVDLQIGMSPYNNLLRWVFVKCEPKSSQFKEPKT